MNGPLLAVKLFLPPPSQNQTERPHLLRQLETGSRLRLTLVCAPAGFGKSSLLSTWIHQQRNTPAAAGSRIYGWLSLDAADNDPIRFWTYFMAAIQAGGEPGGLGQAGNGADERAAVPLSPLIDLLQADPPPPIELVLDQLINTVASQSNRIILILDDYHVIQTAAIHEQLAYLVDHQPPNLHLIIATRSDPPLPITRLRIRGQLNEIRAAELRFSQAEIEHFLASATGLQFPQDDVRALEASTEGWIAGLQMAVLAMQGLSMQGPTGAPEGMPSPTYEKARELIHAFSGKHVYILDYLADEVFNRQPEVVQTFLLRTSILDRLCAGLCDAVMSQAEQETVSNAAGRPTAAWSSRDVLAYLEKANLFLIPLDSERQWFRYHHLFADLLRVRLDQTWPELKPRLHVQAARWYLRQAMIEEAIQHALAAPDWDLAAELLERHIQTFLERGQLSSVMEWAARMPKEIAAQRAWFTIQQATMMGLAHHLSAFGDLITASEQAIDRLEQSGTASADEIRQLRCNICFQRGYYAVATRQPEQALQLAEDGLKILPDNCPWEAFWLHWLRGYANRSLNHLSLAEEGYQAALKAIAGADLWTDMICLTDQAMVCHLRGDLQKACDLYEQALELGRKRRASGHSYLNRVEGWLSLVLLERNEIEAATQHAQTGLEWSRYWPSTNARSVTFIALGRIQLIKGDLPGAESWFQQAEQERQKSPLMPVNDSLLDYNLVRFWLAKGDLVAANQWARPFQDGWKSQNSDAGFNEPYEMKLLALARVLITQGVRGNSAALNEALDLLDAIRASAQTCERVNAFIEAGVLKAAALNAYAQKQDSSARMDPVSLQSAALNALEDSLSAGEPGGYIRVFIDEGAPMAALLRTLRARSSSLRSSQYSTAYVDQLLAAFPAAGEKEIGVASPPAPNLPEPLTEREREVLALMSTGLSNREMAEQLVLSEGTIKSHVHNIIGKLAAKSRTHALVIAKELGLL